MKFNIQPKIHARGYFSINVLDSVGNDTGKGISDVPNVVTHYGQALARKYEYQVAGFERDFEFAAGTGTVERTESSTALGSELAVARGTVKNGSATGFTDNGDGTETYKRVCLGSYPLGHINETISEIGIHTLDGLVAGQLIKDGAGNPTTVTVLSDEQLVVTYTIEWTYSYDSIPETTGTIDVNGTSTTWTLQVAPIKSGANMRYPARGATAFTGSATAYLLDGTDTVLVEKPLSGNTIAEINNITTITLGETFAPSEGAGDVAAVILASNYDTFDVLNSWCMSRIDFSPAIPKTSSEVLELEVSWELTGT